MNRPSHALMALTETTALLAALRYPADQAVAAGVVAAVVAHVPDIDHRSRGLWNDYRDWLHCVEPWLILVVPLLLRGGGYAWAGWVIVGAVGSHLLGDSFTTAGVPLSIILRAVTGKTWGLKLFRSTVRTPLRRKGYRETIPATLTALGLSAVAIVTALAVVRGGASSLISLFT